MSGALLRTKEGRHKLGLLESEQSESVKIEFEQATIGPQDASCGGGRSSGRGCRGTDHNLRSITSQWDSHRCNVESPAERESLAAISVGCVVSTCVETT